MRWLRLLAGAALIAALCWRFGTDAFVAGLRALGPAPIFVALTIGAVTTLASAARWRLVAAGLGLRLPFREAVGDYYGAQFLNGVLPAGVLGDVHRAVQHGRRSGDVGRGVRAVVLERVAGQAVVLVAALAVLAFRPELLPRQVVLCLGLVAVAAVAVASVMRRRLRQVWAADIRSGLLAAWPGVAGWSLFAVAGHLTLFVVAARAAGASAPLSVLLPLLVLALLAMGLPLNVGGFGPREGAAAVSFAAAGLGAELGVTVSVGYGALALVSTLPGGAVLLLRRMIPRREVPSGQVSSGWWRGIFEQSGGDSPRSLSFPRWPRRRARLRTPPVPATSSTPPLAPCAASSALGTGSSKASRTPPRQ
ncbi:lysylphosphatidylglycerol synthase transmembrane domain-containing protein [Amycolatopsis benzoatilytica]|uniref:lysylphosphatidylglycerol synthase transmembrane domain-containing protein n=1 Tax=Amycolatopsis benzoatilytica TaxID=346045 RepID=UPI00035D88DB|nr:lysylphosphatidylglycerol synthase transmembrane domain-containing protein [Amycolatopsis benzoatilytica]